MRIQCRSALEVGEFNAGERNALPILAPAGRRYFALFREDYESSSSGNTWTSVLSSIIRSVEYELKHGRAKIHNRLYLRISVGLPMSH